MPNRFTKPEIHLNRRHILGMGVVGAMSHFVTDWLHAEASGRSTSKGKTKSVIMIFNGGAPSHIDLWDMKPDAPAGVRGQFRPVATNVPGIQISEIMPRLACLADKCAIVRTLHHRHSSHNSGMYWSIVGRPYRMDSTLINPNRTDLPSIGTLVGWLARNDGYNSPLPPYIITPEPSCDSFAYLTPGQFGGCLGGRHDPFVLNNDPNAPNFRIANVSLATGMTDARVNERRSLLSQIDDQSHLPVNTSNMELGIHREKAFSLVTSPEVHKAFDLSREPASLRDHYGRHRWGQSHLLARRLIEAGVRFVTTVNGPSITWDTHKDNFNALKNRLVPPMDQSFSALLEDLDVRGLLDSTLIVWMGDFGRSPIINATAGRDHWPACYSMVLAGGGIRGGQVIGESDRMGAYPKNRPITPADIHATIFSSMGYDPHNLSYPSAEGRPFPLSDGDIIPELL